MTELEKKMIAAAGLREEDFLPGRSPAQRLDALESAADDMILLMADLIGGM